MSGTFPVNPPECLSLESESVELVIDGRPRDLGGFSVRRLLPSMKRRLVGPFIFFDHMGPAHLPGGQGMDVRPHPHISLATVTYLFEGEIDHKDSLGTTQTIRPGDVNWMLAGHGIVHSERSGADVRKTGVHIHGIQSWVALPTAQEEADPKFEHHPASSIPKIRRDRVILDVIAGTALGERSPVSVLSPTLYAHALFEAGGSITIDEEHEQRAIYVVSGAVGCDGRTFREGTMVVLRPGKPVTLSAPEASRVMLLGGAPLDGERHILWNFVSSTKERLAKAKDDWKSGRFPKVPGDDLEFIPFPD